MSGYVNVGEIIAEKYRVERVLGIGGMGMVVAATHLDLGQEVAIKLMLPHAIGNANAVARFMHEAQAVARLRYRHARGRHVHPRDDARAGQVGARVHAPCRGHLLRRAVLPWRYVSSSSP
ncbi:MAG TPA: hypothetical protein VFQ65_16530, partial [Kofleriaceae bacterium]|nr:hypothetical protein [Kofleriaceae bacterium]